MRPVNLRTIMISVLTARDSAMGAGWRTAAGIASRLAGYPSARVTVNTWTAPATASPLVVSQTFLFQSS